MCYDISNGGGDAAHKIIKKRPKERNAMSNVGKQFPSEMSTYVDKKSGKEIVKLTASGVNYHLYFTENSFTGDDKAIIYRHFDGSLQKPESAINLFKLDLETGVRTQLTDFDAMGLRPHVFNKTINGDKLFYNTADELWAIDVATGEHTLLARCPVGYSFGSTSVSYDNRYIAVVAGGKTHAKLKSSHENYGGFLENFYGIKSGRIMIAATDGSGYETIYEDTHWLGHVQFAPDTNEFITYCHEGPWNYVQQRIWMLNTITRRSKPCYVQEEKDSLGHEFWTRDGMVFYDNRGRGHDGTITSDKSQAVTMDYDGPDDIPEVGFVDKDCNVVRTLQLPYYCNHYHANIDNTKLVADAVNDIVLMDISTDNPTIETLCEHNTSWRYQAVHCHPTWSWSNNAILYASDRDVEGEPQLYLVKP